MWVAAGTIFLDVLVWRAQPDRALSISSRDATQSTRSAPLFRLKGHEGSIHRRARYSTEYIKPEAAVRHGQGAVA